MSTVDPSTYPKRKRVMHVPLTDGEWLALRLRSVETDTTLGDMAAFALRRTFPNLTRQEDTK